MLLLLYLCALLLKALLAMSLEVWIAIMLAGITVLVTILGLMLALLAVAVGLAAFWGYAGVKDAASKQAAFTARHISLESVTKKAIEAAREAAAQTAELTITANKDKWLKDLDL